MEVLSSSDWNFINKFNPNYFVGVDEEKIDKKIEILKKYDKVVRKLPHSRSEENIRSLSIYRGCQSGYNMAEAFETAFEIGE